ncbi:MAG TPA: NAD-dependent epimerase/dehydratase family protein, partial [Acidobacteriaceae bacterium]|nr:NAD-dependent epimerase/dehydratase family protein [Acidobacteriaceae bacterium]
MRIVIPGGSGQIGQILARHFSAKGDHVTVFSRTPMPSEEKEPWETLPWNAIHEGPWADALEGSDVCINLTGRSVNCRYNAANRAAILNSRIDSTRVLGNVIASLMHPPAVWLNASTATIYRHALPDDPPNDEITGVLGGGEPGAPDTWNFSTAVAKAWEAAFDETPTPRTRKVALRSAMTFSPSLGGVFDVFLSLVRHGLGGTV